ncbi:hypothetical protein [Caldimonas brevitalea]|uniref:Uncharacterized protein n=1 Tax=Caldimonas brevitalea TaxID=413882 RepID=A0A0G3BJJ0_9BURK|nr:hypothetical protein [Caldimonas brevitalea]AKJ29619.1 hypothetical protein AAW51_2928 [Caldimonas brevitalea]
MNHDDASADNQLQEIYRQLKRGLGHEHVTDDNVFGLIELAQRDGHQLLEQELREWQSPCGGDARPSTIAPTPGFNRENVKR